MQNWIFRRIARPVSWAGIPLLSVLVCSTPGDLDFSRNFGSSAAQAQITDADIEPILEVEGVLEAGDLVLGDDSLYDEYVFQGRAGETVSITLESLEFDTYLLLWGEKGERIAANNNISSDIIADTQNSWISQTLPADGEYRIIVNTHRQWGQGAYRLVVISGERFPMLSDIALEQAEANRFLECGIEQFRVSQFREALTSWQAALIIYQEIGDRIGKGRALGNLGNVYNTLGQYQQAIELYGQQLVIVRETSDRVREGNALGNLGIAYYNLGQYLQAIELYEQQLAIAREVDDRAGEGSALGNLGNAYNSLGQYQQAIDLYEQQIAITREINDRAGESRAIGNLGTAYSSLGQYQRAINLYEQRLAIARETGDRAGEGRAIGNLGTAYSSLGQYQQAIDLHKQRLAIVHEIGDRAGEGITLGNLGNAYNNLGQYQQAIDLYEQRLIIAREIGDRAGEGITLGNLGVAYRNLSQYQQAIGMYEQRLAIAQEIDDRAGEADALGNSGVIHLDLGQYQQAIHLFDQQKTIAQEIGDRAGEGIALGNLGIAYRNLGQYQRAINLYEQQRAIAREIGDRAREGIALGNLGIAYRSLGQYQRAINLYEQRLIIAREIGDRVGEGIALGNLGAVYKNLGKYQQAVALYKQQLAIVREVNNQAVESAALNNLGATLHDMGNFLQAEEELLNAVDSLESLRLGGLSEDDRISLVDTQRSAFQNLQRTLIAQDKVFDALEIAERGRTSVFREELEKRLKPESVTQDILHINIDQIRQIASEKNVTLVEYSIVSNEVLYVWVVQPSGKITFRQLNLQEQDINLLRSVELARESIGVPRLVTWGEESKEEDTLLGPEQTNQQLRQLHQLLIAPIIDLLPDNPTQSVIFIPQDELFLVPFAALQDSDGSYLIDHHTILTAPSIATLENTQELQQRVQQDGMKENLVIGNPTMPTLSVIPGESSTRLQALPGAEQEAVDIADLLGTEPLLGGKATKSSVVQQMSNARIIHLATHGILDEFQGLNGGVVLAADGTGEFNDGLLTAAEIAQMDLSAELVVLSACNTGQGRITGDGVVGLSRSLILAGVPSVVVSLWAVPDAPTGELMVEFYRQLEQTGNKAQALRQAMLTIREQYPDPIAWAGFTLIGEAE